MQHARRILLECENAEREMADLSENKSYTLHLGLSPTLAFRFQHFLYTEELIAPIRRARSTSRRAP